MTVIGFGWFIFDLVINYPFQTALVILSLCVLSSIRWIFAKFLQLVFGRTPAPAGRDFYDAPARPANMAGLGARGEFNALTSRIDGMERRTDMLNEKLDQLASSMERVLENMDD